jgi:membrane fusion protein (multidrug efflux system)
MAQEQSTNSAASKKQKFPIKLVVILLIVAIAGYFGYQKISFAIHHQSTDNAQVETQIIPVLPRVSGYVKTLNVKDYDSVKFGDLLVELDDAELQSQLAEQEADYNQSAIDIINAKATQQQALISLNVNKGTIDISNTKKQKALDDYNRDKNLFASEAITKKQLDESKFNYETAVKQWDNTINDLKSADSRLPVLNAAVQKAESGMSVKKAKIDQTKLKLTYTKIFAPVAGKIGKKSISIGQFVQAGSPLFSIVNDSTYWIVANFKENQIRKLFTGKEVEIKLDAFPDINITGTIASLSDATGAKFALLPPDNSSGNFVKVTQRVPVRINISNTEKYKDILRAGLSAEVIVEIK